MSARAVCARWLAESTERTAIQLPRALIASALAAALDFGVLIVLVERGGWGAQSAAVVSYLLGGVLQYVLCACWVFPACPQNAATGFTAFTVLSLVGLAITWAVIGGLHDVLGVNYAAAKVVALGAAFTWNFLSRKFWLFRPALRPAAA